MIDIDNVRKIELSENFILCFRYDDNYDLETVTSLEEYSAAVFGKENIIWLPKNIEIIGIDVNSRRYI